MGNMIGNRITANKNQTKPSPSKIRIPSPEKKKSSRMPIENATIEAIMNSHGAAAMTMIPPKIATAKCQPMTSASTKIIAQRSTNPINFPSLYI